MANASSKTLRCLIIYDERRSKMYLDPVPWFMIHAEYHGAHTLWKCVFNYALGKCVVCTYIADRVSCILYHARCLWREWMNNFRLSESDSSQRAANQVSKKVCSVNHRGPSQLYLTKAGGGSRKGKPSCGRADSSGLAHNSLACAVGEFTSPRAASRMRPMEFSEFVEFSCVIDFMHFPLNLCPCYLPQ